MSSNFSFLSFLNVSLRNRTNSGMIYANSRNEVELIVSIMALDESGAQVFLTNAQMAANLSLCDYYTRASIESDGWHNGAGQGEYISDGILLDHSSSISASFDGKEALSTLQISPQTGYLLPQSFTMRVSVSPGVYAAKSIAVKFFDGGDTTYDTANGSSYASCVILTPVAEKTYTTDDLFYCAFANTEIVEGVTQTHEWDFNKKSIFYSFSNKNLYIKAMESSLVSSNSQDALIRSDYYTTDSSTHSISIYVDGLKSGGTTTALGPDNKTYTFTKNERVGQLCITRIDGTYTGKADKYRVSDKVTLFDQYGNKGVFTITTDASEAANILITD